MNPILETIILFGALIAAILFIFRKRIWKKSKDGDCGNGNCKC
jgi:uncharacterized membrane protein